MPKLLFAFCGQLQRLFCCCFPPAKVDDKANSKQDGTVQNSKNQPVTNSGNSGCLPCLRRRVQVETIANGNAIFVAEAGGIKSKSGGTTDGDKSKCDFCDRCEKCQEDFDKDKTKGKNKKEVESKCSALNYLAFLIVFILMIASNIGLWLVMSV